MSTKELKDAFPDMQSEEGNKKVADHLRTIRKARGFTLELLSEQTGLSVSYISRLEAGSRRMNLDILTSVAQALQCEISDIIYGHTQHIVSFQDLGRQYSFGMSGHDHHKSISASGSRSSKKKGVVAETMNSLPYGALHKDLPLYGSKIAAPGQKAEEGVFDFDKARSFLVRHPEMIEEKDAFAIVIPDNHYLPRYSAGDTLIVSPTKPLVYKSPVMIIMNDNSITLGLFQDWVEGGVSIFVMKSEELVISKVLSDDMKSIYRIVSVLYA